MKKVAIIPTGDEIRSGLVVDTNSPVIMAIILEKYPRANIERVVPVKDKTRDLYDQIYNRRTFDLIVVIGGSGGGKKYDPNLAEDITHIVLDDILEKKHIKEIYGFNGHLWSRLVIGMLGNLLVFNVPGPMVEAEIVTKVAIESLSKNLELADIANIMAKSLIEKYPKGGRIL